MRKALVFLAACSGSIPTTDPPGSGDDVQAPDAGGDPVVDPCSTPVIVPTSGRAVDLMPPSRLAMFAAHMPCVGPGLLRDVLESPRTLWYDKTSLTPGYQDSFGDNQIAPIGMRPNTIDPGLIDLAVPGGHAQIFAEVGKFHFPFGNPIGAQEAVTVVDFWQLPIDQPVVYWQRDPNEYTHRVEWMFPKGTVFGEMLFLGDYPFEIRTRTRTHDGWQVDAYRPFPAASDLVAALVEHHSTGLDALVAQLADDTSMDTFALSSTHFPGAFPQRTSKIDRLPTMNAEDAAILHELLLTTEFRSARGTQWKPGAWAASASGTGSIVPKGYNAAAVEISEASCDGCHRDAGRPFMTWYDNILAYGELWGNDEIFTWHPFTLAKFVDGQGRVVDFNYDNREIRPDFATAKLVAPYDASKHTDATYHRITREWTDFHY